MERDGAEMIPRKQVASDAESTSAADVSTAEPAGVEVASTATTDAFEHAVEASKRVVAPMTETEPAVAIERLGEGTSVKASRPQLTIAGFASVAAAVEVEKIRAAGLGCTTKTSLEVPSESPTLRQLSLTAALSSYDAYFKVEAVNPNINPAKLISPRGIPPRAPLHKPVLDVDMRRLSVSGVPLALNPTTSQSSLSSPSSPTSRRPSRQPSPARKPTKKSKKGDVFESKYGGENILEPLPPVQTWSHFRCASQVNSLVPSLSQSYDKQSCFKHTRMHEC
eukprot:1184249-Prorocentrum_minimum.AAC.6